ncbi:UDP-glycosyltransferase 87A1 [Morus notabilis]|uniref:Glycosyltransferase n=1 Tax=Morus notabilis TaxID=981085 RepID=W9RIC6_9ROSA|nr:UDP-glycosyltransferase 87A1 [Morus notabilis]EXB78534.1 UDP-glycosyltransferase 87A1 [Morus notabilis]
MTNQKSQPPTTVCHVVAMPYPGRGHVNPMMNICKQLISRKPDILITFVVTEEWLGLIGSEPKPDNLRFGTLPNVIPSEHGRANDFPGFVKAVSTKLEAPFEELLDRLEPLVSAVVADSYLVWMTRVGNRRNVPVASLWPMSALLFSVFYHFELLEQNGHFPADLSERGDEVVDYIPGVSTMRVADLPTIFCGSGRETLSIALECVSRVSEAQYFLSTSVYELEPQVFDALKAKFAFPIYPIGPSIPHFQLESSSSHTNNGPDYLKWLDSQPKRSVLYISLGSFLSVSSAQLDEIVAGVKNSGASYLWVARGEASRIKDGGGDFGFVVSWCDQLRVLCHPSIGGFLTHCGWNSTLEAIFGGVPMLTFPLFWDQVPNSKRVVEDWKIGLRVKKKALGSDESTFVSRDEISELVKRFMDQENNEGKAMRKRVKELQEACHQAIAKGGSSDTNLDAFIRDISQGHQANFN